MTVRPTHRTATRRTTAARRAAAVGLAVALAACGGGDDEGEQRVGEEERPPDPMESVAEPEAGEGHGVIGIEQLTFTVTACTEGPQPEDTPEASLEHLLEGEGETSDGPFQVSISRYRSETGMGDPVFTETVRIVTGEGADARGLEAKRTTAGADGGWLDLADPEADGPLIERDGQAYDVRGTFGPEQARAGDEGLEDGRIRAACPD